MRTIASEQTKLVTELSKEPVEDSNAQIMALNRASNLHVITTEAPK